MLFSTVEKTFVEYKTLLHILKIQDNVIIKNNMPIPI